MARPTSRPARPGAIKPGISRPVLPVPARPVSPARPSVGVWPQTYPFGVRRGGSRG